MSARSDIADAVALALPTARVIGYARGVDNMPTGQPFAMVYREQVAPGPTQGLRTEQMVVWVAIPQTDPEKADDLLDPLLDDLLDAFTTDPTLRAMDWTLAEREALSDTYPAYKVTATVRTKKETS